MTTFYLIRHGHVDTVNRLIGGRQPGIHLTPQGRQQAEALAERLAEEPIAHLFSSPLDRTRETARPVAERLSLEVHLADDLLELDFGQWTGCEFHDLQSDPHWKRFNAFRSGTRIPGGETMLEVQSRVVGLMERLRDRHPEEAIALVSHGDVIRSALCYWLAVPLDFFQRIEISLASVSILRVDKHGPLVLAMNATLGAPTARAWR
jgi:probable phosphoglycerate mutase